MSPPIFRTPDPLFRTNFHFSFKLWGSKNRYSTILTFTAAAFLPFDFSVMTEPERERSHCFLHTNE